MKLDDWQTALAELGDQATLPCPTFETTPFVDAPPAGERRVAMISTVGLHRRGNRPFSLVSDDYRVIPGDAMANDLVVSHVSTNFDRTGFQQDLNVIFPIDRLREMVGALLVPATKPKPPGSDGDYA